MPLVSLGRRAARSPLECLFERPPAIGAHEIVPRMTTADAISEIDAVPPRRAGGSAFAITADRVVPHTQGAATPALGVMPPRRSKIARRSTRHRPPRTEAPLGRLVIDRANLTARSCRLSLPPSVHLGELPWRSRLRSDRARAACSGEWAESIVHRRDGSGGAEALRASGARAQTRQRAESRT
jgi:hypothetical protein